MDYWCHQCRKKIVPILQPELACPECKGDFIEQLEEESTNVTEDHPSNFVMSDTTNATSTTSSTSTNQSTQQQQPQSQQIPPFPTFFSPSLFGQPNNATSNATPFTFNNAANQQTNIQNGQMPADPFAALFQQFFPPPGRPQPAHHQPTANFVISTATIEPGVNPFATIMNQLLGNGGNLNNIFGESMGIHGNPGDYAWGRQFEDLLNQMFTTHNRPGNPPAAESALNELPKVQIEQHHVDNLTDCSICKDEFELGQTVMKLPCNHLFHPDCITRWLKMHNQCPICRYELPTDDKDYEERKKKKNNITRRILWDSRLCMQLVLALC